VHARLRVKVRYFAAVREIVNLREEILEIEDGSIVIDLLRFLATKYGDKFREYLFEPKSENPKPYLHFFLNEKSIAGIDGYSTKLSNDCTFAIIPPVGGG